MGSLHLAAVSNTPGVRAAAPLSQMSPDVSMIALASLLPASLLGLLLLRQART